VCGAFCHRKGHRHADNKHKKWLDQVPKSQPMPWVVMKLRDELAPKSTWNRQIGDCVIDPCSFGHQEKHDQAAKNIERDETFTGRWFRVDRHRILNVVHVFSGEHSWQR